MTTLQKTALCSFLAQFGADVTKLRCGVYYCTSDVGNACMSAFPFYELNGTRFRLGKGITLRHEGDASIAKILRAFKGIGYAVQRKLKIP